MPAYSVEHSFPLNPKQKQALASAITKLHGAAFKAPSIFVQVTFHQVDSSANNHFIGGKIMNEYTNRITGFVRTSPSRSVSDFDKLAEQLENAWYVCLGERADKDTSAEEFEKKQKESKEGASSHQAKELISVIFMGGLMGREKGFTIPEAGKEKEWFASNKKDFTHRAEMGDNQIKDLLEEVETREDLKDWRA